MIRLSLILLLFSLPVRADQYQDAKNHAIEALYEYEHWNEDVNAVMNHYGDKLSKDQKEYGGYALAIFRMIQYKEVKFTWKFP